MGGTVTMDQITKISVVHSGPRGRPCAPTFPQVILLSKVHVSLSLLRTAPAATTHVVRQWRCLQSAMARGMPRPSGTFSGSSYVRREIIERWRGDLQVT